MKWREMHLEELGSVARGRSRHRPRDAAHLYDGPYPFVQTGDIKAADLYLNRFSQTYSEAGLAQSKLWPAGTLCITIAANIADTAILGIDACFPDSVIGFTAAERKADVRFIKYKFDTIKRQYQQVSQGATQDNLSLEKLLSFKLSVPPFEEQQRIAEVLTAYDELMENNRRRMALLEEAARQLYAEWFVRLRYPGHARTRRADTLPKGWTRRPLGELCTFLNRGIAPHYNDDAEGLVINQKCIRNGRLDVTLARRQSRQFKLDRQVQLGDVLINSTGEGTLGRIAQVKSPIPNCTVDTHVTIVRPQADIGMHYIGESVLRWEPRLSTMGRGATNQTELSRGDIGGVEIVVPPPPLVKRFEEFAAPLFAQVVNLASQNQKLRIARDLLLPRLMSGEIAVSGIPG